MPYLVSLLNFLHQLLLQPGATNYLLSILISPKFKDILKAKPFLYYSQVNVFQNTTIAMKRIILCDSLTSISKKLPWLHKVA